MTKWRRQLSSTSSNSDGASASSSAVLSAAALLPAADPSDPCLWANGQQCGVPRSCFDCLNTPAIKGQCMVDPAGRCVRSHSLDPSSDYHSRNATTLLLYYTSATSSYCAPTDDTCTTCRRSLDATGWYFVRPRPAALTPAPFCVGANGCVCVATCEAPSWNVSVLATCSTQLTNAHLSQNPLYMAVTVATTALFAVLFFFSTQWVKKTRTSQVGDLTNQRDRQPRRLGLGLAGWHSMRQKLIDEEEGAAHDGGHGAAVPTGA